MKWGSRLSGWAITGVTILFLLAGTGWLGSRISALRAAGEHGIEAPGVPPGEDRRPLFGLRPPRHGALGIVLRVEGDTIVIRGRYGIQRTVFVTQDTVIERGGQGLGLGDIHPGEPLIVVGSPRPEGVIQARFIRVFEPRSRQEDDAGERDELHPIVPTSK